MFYWFILVYWIIGDELVYCFGLLVDWLIGWFIHLVIAFFPLFKHHCQYVFQLSLPGMDKAGSKET